MLLDDLLFKEGFTGDVDVLVVVVGLLGELSDDLPPRVFVDETDLLFRCDIDGLTILDDDGEDGSAEADAPFIDMDPS